MAPCNTISSSHYLNTRDTTTLSWKLWIHYISNSMPFYPGWLTRNFRLLNVSKFCNVAVKCTSLRAFQSMIHLWFRACKSNMLNVNFHLTVYLLRHESVLRIHLKASPNQILGFFRDVILRELSGAGREKRNPIRWWKSIVASFYLAEHLVVVTTWQL